MKVAILTLHRVYNYGSVLQAYATQRIFEKMGHDVSVVDYITPQRTLLKIYLAPSANGNINGVSVIAYHIAKIGSLILKQKTFGRFIRKNLYLTKKYITADDLAKDPPKADLYVTGSDQTWNSTYNEGVDRGFFLDFLPENSRRISFVASFGKAELDDSEIELTKKHVQRYEGLSVREDSAKQILCQLGRDDAVQLVDPTLQISRDEWLKLASRRLLRQRYLILMLLYNEDNNATEYARRIADEKGLKLVKLSWELKCPPMVDQLMTHRSPADFLSLFYYADFVVTNSFHGLAFSINMEKQFIVVPRKEYNSRIESLLTLCGLKQRMINTEERLEQCCSTCIDYLPIREILEDERQRAKHFLEVHMAEV